MPLLKGKSAAIRRRNQHELERSKPSKSRAKAIKTLARKRGISTAQAKHLQAAIIAKSKANRRR